MVVGQVQVCSDTVYMCVNKQGTLERLRSPRKWYRRLQLAILCQLGKMNLQDVREFCEIY